MCLIQFVAEREKGFRDSTEMLGLNEILWNEEKNITFKNPLIIQPACAHDAVKCIFSYL